MMSKEAITSHVAERLLEDANGESQGALVLDGTTYEWWTDGKSCVWFYEPGKDGEDTLKRFENDGCLHEVAS